MDHDYTVALAIIACCSVFVALQFMILNLQVKKFIEDWKRKHGLK